MEGERRIFHSIHFQRDLVSCFTNREAVTELEEYTTMKEIQRISEKRGD
jgi:hypothetical protein